MRRILVVAAVGYSAACGTFGGSKNQDPPADPTGSDAGATDATNPPVDGVPADYRFTLDPLPDTVPIVQGLTAKVKITVRRGKNLHGPILVKTRDFRDGVGFTSTMIAGDSAEIDVAAPATAPQGAANGLVEATGSSKDAPADITTVTTPLRTLVRGAPGALDTTYGNAGFATGLFAGSGTIWDLVLAPDDSVYVIAACAADQHVCVAHLDATGKIDLTYGAGGTATLGLDDYGGQGALQSDGKLLVIAGTNSAAAGIGRLDAKGQADTSFGTGSFGPGTNALSTGGLSGQNNGPVGLALRADGDIFVAWDNGDGASTKNGSMRLGSNGLLRTAYGGGGATRNAIGYSTAMTVRNDPKAPSFGNLVMIWTGTDAINFQQIDGNTAATDPAFGVARTYALTGTGRSGARHPGLVALSDGSVVAPFRDGNKGLYLFKFAPLGVGSPGFGTNGLAGPFPYSGEGPSGIALQADGKILVAIAQEGGPADVLRFTAAGALDRAFGQNGHATPRRPAGTG